MTTTAGDQINGALRLIGQLAEGETPSAATSQDALTAMNQMIDSWSIERLAVFSTQDQVFMWPPGAISRTLGPTGDFVGNRPVLLDDSTYFRDPANNISFGIKILNQQQYNGIAVKTVTSTYLPTGDLGQHDLPRHRDVHLPGADQGAGVALRLSI